MSASVQPVLEHRIAALAAELERLRSQMDGVFTFFEVWGSLAGTPERVRASLDAAGVRATARARHLRVVR